MRTIVSLNGEWKFTKNEQTEIVSVPHTWNNVDGQDGGNDYYRGTCQYERTFLKPKMEEDGKLFLEFKGVNASAEVFVNGSFVVRHDGGYSTFRADITKYLQDENTLVVKVDNSVNETVYPQKADFTFYGGIYRDVNLIAVPKNHFDLSYHGAGGIRVTPTVRDGKGEVVIEGYKKGEGEVRVTVYDAKDNALVRGMSGEMIVIDDPHLWNGVKDPYLYRAVARLFVDDKFVDEVETKFGFRTFFVDPKRGFFLNGKSYPLRGVSRHQDRKELGNAISRKEHEEDIKLIREMGANTVRCAHYQHDDTFYDLCDEYGLVVWAEIPYISRHMVGANDNTRVQMTEMIYQLYNHPSIVVWGLSNEITMYPLKSAERKDMIENHKKLNELCHLLDPTRMTTMACFMLCGAKNEIAKISDVVSWNFYFGWYLPGLHLNKMWFNNARKGQPKRCFGLSEYGAEGMPNLHSLKPKRGDNTEEYQCIYHEYMAKFISESEFLWATHVWNMFDFAADGRNQGGEPGMNHKGLVTFDRKIKKDAFYLYKAYWSDEPFVHLCGKRFVNRTGKELQIKVYSNQPSVSLYINGERIEEKKGDKVFTFTVPMQERNQIEVRAGGRIDQGVVVKVAKPDQSYIVDPGENKSWQV